MARREAADAVAVEGVEDEDGDREIDEGEDRDGVGGEDWGACAGGAGCLCAVDSARDSWGVTSICICVSGASGWGVRVRD